MIVYRDDCEGIGEGELGGFFVGWANPPKPAVHLALLRGSRHVVLAYDDETERVVGFVTALTDGVLSAYIPFVEVLPDYQDRGIGAELTRRMLARLKDYYAVDLLCDESVQRFYARFRMLPASGMILRRYELQAGRIPDEGPPEQEAAPKKPSIFGRLLNWLRK
jgi:hypothetical protein